MEELQRLYEGEQNLLKKLMYSTDPRQQRLIRTRIGWINTMMEKIEENTMKE